MMNQHFDNLMYQSGLTAQGCWDEMDDYAKQAIAKFAELIVKECAKAADEGLAQVTMKVEWPSYHIKKHFGVEE